MRTEKDWAEKISSHLTAVEFSEFVVFMDLLTNPGVSAEFSDALQNINQRINPHLYDDGDNGDNTKGYILENLLTTERFPCRSRTEGEALAAKLLVGFYERVDRAGEETKYINKRNKVAGKVRLA